jgi:uncharacterized protein YhbP (UPF0306 family)
MDEDAGSRARELAEQIVGELRYVVLATSDAAGMPWASPVYFAHRGVAEFFWVSRPSSTHSTNIEARPEVGLVVFDSRIDVGAGRGVYARAVADALAGDELAEALEVYTQRSLVDGAGSWDERRLEAAGFRLYRARTTAVSVLTGEGPDLRVDLPT